MAFNPDQSAAPFRYVAKVVLDSKTYWFADVDMVLSDGTWCDGRLMLGQTTISKALGSLIESKYITQSFTLALNNNDDVVRGYIDTYQWANRTVTLYITHGTDVANLAELQTGVVRFPAGISYLQAAVYISCDDPRDKHSLQLPATRMEPATYPNMEAKSQYKYKPIVYGSWLSTDPGAIALPAYQVDSTVGTGGTWLWAGHACKQLEAVYLNGVSSAFTANADNSGFTLNVAYATATDTVTVHGRGATDDGLITGTLLQNPALILKDILKTRLGLVDANLDLTAFTDYQTNTSELCRRWIGGSAQTSSSTLIQELLNETWCDLPIVSGKYKPVYRIVSTVGATTNFYEWDIQKSGSGAGAKALFRVLRDPDRICANRVVGKYRHDPIAGTYGVTYQFDDTAAQAAYLTVRQRTPDMNFLWIYVQADVETRVQREVYVFGSAEPEVANISLAQKAILKGPTDQFGLVFDKYGDAPTGYGTPFQIRSSQMTLGSLILQVSAWNMLMLSPGRWAGSAATTWLLSTAWERQTQGYWTDANGYADTSPSPDAASKRSRWF